MQIKSLDLMTNTGKQFPIDMDFIKDETTFKFVIWFFFIL